MKRHLKRSSASDMRVISQAKRHSVPELDRVFRHYRTAGRERGDYKFDIYASDLVKSIIRQVTVPSTSKVMLAGIMSGFKGV